MLPLSLQLKGEKAMRNMAGSTTIPFLINIAEKCIDGNAPTPYEGDDHQLLGGDFIADSSGKLVWAHIMHDMFDRPSVDTIVAALDSTSD